MIIFVLLDGFCNKKTSINSYSKTWRQIKQSKKHTQHFYCSYFTSLKSTEIILHQYECVFHEYFTKFFIQFLKKIVSTMISTPRIIELMRVMTNT